MNTKTTILATVVAKAITSLVLAISVITNTDGSTRAKFSGARDVIGSNCLTDTGGRVNDGGNGLNVSIVGYRENLQLTQTI